MRKLAIVRTFRSTSGARGRARSRELARRFGGELRVPRVTSGLTQARLAALAGVTQQHVSLAELGDVNVSLEARCGLAEACGHELGWRLYPVATVRLRDSGQLGLAQAIARALHATWRVRLEVPVSMGDPRAADLVLDRREELVQIEVERSLVDFQAQLRSAQLKRQALAAQEDRPIRLVIAVPDTAASRSRIVPFADLVRRTMPKSSRGIWAALRSGEPVGSDGILFVRAARHG